MKHLYQMSLLATGLLCAVPLSAQPTTPSPLLGTWALDVSRMPIPVDQRPKSVTFTYSDAGAGRWKTQVDIVAPDGSATHGVSTYTRDGSAVPVEGSPEADIAAVTMPRPDVMILALSKGGVPGSIRITTVHPDGKSFTETATYFGRDGKPVMRTNYFTRVR